MRKRNKSASATLPMLAAGTGLPLRGASHEVGAWGQCPGARPQMRWGRKESGPFSKKSLLKRASLATPCLQETHRTIAGIHRKTCLAAHFNLAFLFLVVGSAASRPSSNIFRLLFLFYGGGCSSYFVAYFFLNCSPLNLCVFHLYQFLKNLIKHKRKKEKVGCRSPPVGAPGRRFLRPTVSSPLFGSKRPAGSERHANGLRSPPPLQCVSFFMQRLQNRCGGGKGE